MSVAGAIPPCQRDESPGSNISSTRNSVFYRARKVTLNVSTIPWFPNIGAPVGAEGIWMGVASPKSSKGSLKSKWVMNFLFIRTEIH